MPKKFFFHIGLPRCASTMIETEFLVPDHLGHDRLRASRILPLRNLHDALRQCAGKPTWEDPLIHWVIDQCIAPHADDPAADAFFSSDEGLTLTYSETTAPPDLNHRADSLARMLDGFEPTLILLVRNQVAYIQSLYGLYLQSGGTAEFPAFVNSLALGAMDWYAVAESYARVFGRERLVVLPFERDVYARSGAPHADFLAALQATLCIAQPLALADVRTYNPSLPVVLMPVQQQINEALDRDSAIRVADIIRSSVTRQAVAEASLFDADQANQVRRAFARSNAALFETFLPGYDGTSYQPA